MQTLKSKSITSISLLVPLIFPIIYSGALFNQSSFPKALFFYFCSQIIAFLFIWYSSDKGSIVIPKNYILLGLFGYILVLFITGLFGENFRQSFWSYYPHMTGIITWIHFFIFYIAISSVYQEVNWKHFFRALSISTMILLIFSYLGPDGFNMSSVLSSGGSLLTNNTKSGMYYLLFFFVSSIAFSLEKGKKWRLMYIFILIAIFFSPELFNNDILRGNVGMGSIIEDPMKLLGMARLSTIVLWLGMIVSGILYFIHKIKQEKLKIKLIVGGIILFLVIYGVVFSRLMNSAGSVSVKDAPGSISSRLIVWGGAIDAIGRRPIVGYGIENFDYIYQRNLDPRIINLEAGGAWFDRAHNFLLDELSSVGLAGVLILVVLFVTVVWLSLRLYREQKKFHYLLIPYIFVFHFIQMQTAFQTITSLFLIFVLFAYLSSQEENTLSLAIPSKTKNSIKVISTLLLLTLLYFVVYIPLKQSSILTKLESSGTFSKRINAYQENEKSIKNLSISPDQTIQRYMNEYIFTLASHIDTVYENNQTGQAKEEVLLYLDLYESYYPQYKNKYKFLIYYAHAINFAYMLGIDELKKGEEILHEALAISEAYPHPNLILSINLYNQERVEEALLQAKRAYDIDPSIIKSREVYETLKTLAKLHGSRQPFFYLSDI